MTKEFQNIRTGVIGVGSMGQNHARIYNEISNLVAVADPDEEQGIEVSKRLGVKWYSDYKKMLKEVDAVTIAVPTIFHRQVSEICSNAKIHILLEKPISDNLVDSKKIVEMAKQAQIKLAIGHIERHNPAVSFAKKSIHNGDWGQVISISSRRVSKFPERIKDVGVVFDLAIHDLDIISYFANSEFNSIQSIGGRIEYPDKEDHMIAIINFDKGINAVCEASWLTPMKVRELSITCSKAFVKLNLMDQKVDIFRSDIKTMDNINLWKTKYDIKVENIDIEKREPLKLEIEDFLDSVVSDREPLVTGEEGIKAVEMAQIITNQINDKND